MTVQRWVSDISKGVETQIFNKCNYYLLAVYESVDISSTTQMCICAWHVWRTCRSPFNARL